MNSNDAETRKKRIFNETVNSVTWITIISVFLSYEYIRYCACCSTETLHDCFLNVGTIMPVIVLISTALTEGVKNMLSALRQEKYREEGKAKGREEGKAEGREEITAEVLDILKRYDINGDALKEVEALSPNVEGTTIKPSKS